jgi:hypothetical protein
LIAFNHPYFISAQGLLLGAISIKEHHWAIGIVCQCAHNSRVGFGDVSDEERRPLNARDSIGRLNSAAASLRGNEQQHSAIGELKVSGIGREAKGCPFSDASERAVIKPQLCSRLLRGSQRIANAENIRYSGAPTSLIARHELYLIAKKVYACPSEYLWLGADWARQEEHANNAECGKAERSK